MAMRIPYILQLASVLTANGTGTMQYTVPPNEGLEISELIFTSTGAFSVTDLRVSGGHVMTNAGTNNPIPSTALRNGANNNNTLYELKIPLILKGGQVLYVDLLDTSAAPNTVRLTSNCIREI